MHEYGAEESKITGIEATLMIGMCLVFDVIDIGATFLDAAFGAGEFIKIFNNIIASLILFFWVTIKGMSSARTLIGAGIELIPFINVLPVRTITMIATVWADQHPRATNVAAAVAPIIRPGIKMARAKKITAPKTTTAA